MTDTDFRTAVVTLLTEIRDDQRALVKALQEPLPDAAPAPCTHPPEFRTDSTPGARFWKCRRENCGFIYDSEHVKGAS